MTCFVTKTLINEDAGLNEPYEFDHDFPATREKCETCDGKGTHVNRAIDGNGLSEEKMDDPEFMENYMSGVYDVACEECGGDKIVKYIDRDSADPKMLALLDEAERVEREMDAAEAAERRMGA